MNILLIFLFALLDPIEAPKIVEKWEKSKKQEKFHKTKRGDRLSEASFT